MLASRTRTLVLALAASLLGAPAAGDPLDKVSGTEGWEHAGPEDVEAEWKDWYRGRVEWRRASRELRVQRVVSQRLARILERSGETSFEEIKQIIVAGMRGLPADPDLAPAPAPSPSPPPPVSRPPGKRRPAPPPPPDDTPMPDPEPDPTPPAPRPGKPKGSSDGGNWSKVPVERLDKDGQAIDDEGEKVLKKATEKKRTP